jgi:hypothetical protein
MRRNLTAYRRHQVFLNFPYDDSYAPLASAMQFGVVSAGLLPVCAKDLTTPDHSRLDMLVDAIANCHYSIHDLSRSSGEGPKNFSRMNMPIETGMALFHALATQRSEHRCAFFVATQHDYQIFASDLAGLDPKCHHNDDLALLSYLYEWLRAVVPSALMSPQPTIAVQQKFAEYKSTVTRLNGSGAAGLPTHEEAREVMYQVCHQCGWWDWRHTRAGLDEFPILPLSWKDATGT